MDCKLTLIFNYGIKIKSILLVDDVINEAGLVDEVILNTSRNTIYYK
jgi:hypothetical protein